MFRTIYNPFKRCMDLPLSEQFRLAFKKYFRWAEVIFLFAVLLFWATQPLIREKIAQYFIISKLPKLTEESPKVIQPLMGNPMKWKGKNVLWEYSDKLAMARISDGPLCVKLISGNPQILIKESQEPPVFLLTIQLKDFLVSVSGKPSIESTVVGQLDPLIKEAIRQGAPGIERIEWK